MVHIVEHLGRIKLVIGKENDVVKVIGVENNPLMDFCPLWNKKIGIPKVSHNCARKNMERLIKKYGMFTEKRRFDLCEPFVTYGTSEIMMTALKRRIIDAAVIVCDGAGTVIIDYTKPSLVQGIAAEMPGIIYTEPIEETIETLSNLGGIVLDKKRAKINQVEGAKKAIEENYKKIAVCIAEPSDAKELRNMENDEHKMILMGVHHSGRSIDEVDDLIKTLDIMPNCRGKTIPEKLKPLHIEGEVISMCAITPIGKELLYERAKEAKNEKKRNEAKTNFPC